MNSTTEVKDDNRLVLKRHTDTQPEQKDTPKEKPERVMEWIPENMANYLHAEIHDGEGMFIDGPDRDLMALEDSARQVYAKLSAAVVVKGDISTPRSRFLTDYSRLFKKPYSVLIKEPVNDTLANEVLSGPTLSSAGEGKKAVLKKTVIDANTKQPDLARQKTDESLVDEPIDDSDADDDSED